MGDPAAAQNSSPQKTHESSTTQTDETNNLSSDRVRLEKLERTMEALILRTAVLQDVRRPDVGFANAATSPPISPPPSQAQEYSVAMPLPSFLTVATVVESSQAPHAELGTTAEQENICDRHIASSSSQELAVMPRDGLHTVTDATQPPSLRTPMSVCISTPIEEQITHTSCSPLMATEHTSNIDSECSRTPQTRSSIEGPALAQEQAASERKHLEFSVASTTNHVESVATRNQRLVACGMLLARLARSLEPSQKMLKVLAVARLKEHVRQHTAILCCQSKMRALLAREMLLAMRSSVALAAHQYAECSGLSKPSSSSGDFIEIAMDQYKQDNANAQIVDSAIAHGSAGNEVFASNISRNAEVLDGSHVRQNQACRQHQHDVFQRPQSASIVKPFKRPASVPPLEMNRVKFGQPTTGAAHIGGMRCPPNSPQHQLPGSSMKSSPILFSNTHPQTIPRQSREALQTRQHAATDSALASVANSMNMPRGHDSGTAGQFMAVANMPTCIGGGAMLSSASSSYKLPKERPASAQVTCSSSAADLCRYSSSAQPSVQAFGRRRGRNAHANGGIAQKRFTSCSQPSGDAEDHRRKHFLVATETVTMSVSHSMSIVEHSRRPQSAPNSDGQKRCSVAGIPKNNKHMVHPLRPASAAGRMPRSAP
jgi:hypothetical protein